MEKQNPNTDSIMAIDVQRRLELKEFYLERGEQVAANLVDEMFRISNFDEIKTQVKESFGTLPKNWKGDCRYDKYKKLLKLGVRPEKVREEMEEDGLDPDEFDISDAPKSSNLVEKATRGASKLFRKKSRVYISGALRRTRSKISSKPDLKSFRGTATEIERSHFIRNKKTKKPPTSPKREKEYLSDSDDSNASSLPRTSLYDQDDEEFAYSKEDIQLSKKKRGKNVFGKLTEKNQIGQIHDAKHYFKSSSAKVLRKTAVSNIKRNASVKQSMFEDKHLTLTRDELEKKNRALPPPPPPVAPKRLNKRPVPAIPKRTLPVVPEAEKKSSIHSLEQSKDSENELLVKMAPSDMRKSKRDKIVKTIDLPPPPPIEDDPRTESFFLELPPPPPPPSPCELGSKSDFNVPLKGSQHKDKVGLSIGEKTVAKENEDGLKSYISFQGMLSPVRAKPESKFLLNIKNPKHSHKTRQKPGSRPTQE